jgi:carboxyl-terminal processing protease
MRNNFQKTTLVLAFALMSLAACDTKTPTPDTTTNPTTPAVGSTKLTGDAAVNDWIYDQMKDNYYWTGKMPKKDLLTLNQKPDAYFQTILFDKGVTDRFSWIEESAEELKNSFQGITKSIGYKFTAFSVKESDRIILAVRYAVKGSPAEKAGLKRGDIISKIDGQVLTTANWVKLAYPDTQPAMTMLGLANYVNGVVTDSDKTFHVESAEVTEDPILLTKVITKGSKKIGYLVYNQYINTADSKLRTVFGEFKAQGINELILDLRYNGGGYVSSAQTLSSLIGKGIDDTKNFAVYEYNPTVDANYKKKYGTNYNLLKFTREANNIGANLSRVFVLTSTGTASASEMTINGLRPYMPVVIVGDNTYGKNVGSYTIEDTQTPKRWNWGLQPITFKTTNANGESDYGTKDGFAPSYRLKDNKLPFLALGDEKESLLSLTLDVIAGITTSARKAFVEGPEAIREPISANPTRFGMFEERKK